MYIGSCESLGAGQAQLSQGSYAPGVIAGCFFVKRSGLVSDDQLREWWEARPEEYAAFLDEYNPVKVGYMKYACEYVGRACVGKLIEQLEKELGL